MKRLSSQEPNLYDRDTGQERKRHRQYEALGFEHIIIRLAPLGKKQVAIDAGFGID